MIIDKTKYMNMTWNKISNKVLTLYILIIIQFQKYYLPAFFWNTEDQDTQTTHVLGRFYMAVNCIPLLWWEEHKLQLFENKVLGKIFGPKDVVWSHLWYNEKLRNLHR
jgi:hypothetical protein